MPSTALHFDTNQKATITVRAYEPLPEPAMETADVLANAREHIEKFGWCRGYMLDINNKACGLGAIVIGQNLVGYDNPEVNDRVMPAAKAVLDALHINYADDRTAVGQFITWNDKVAKDEQEVLDAFAKAEKIERAGYDPDA